MMMDSTTDTRACPHCGGQIKFAAMVCKHCTRSVVEAAPATASVPGFGATTSMPGFGPTARALSPVLAELRAFLVHRGIAPRSAVDAVFSSLDGMDAGVALGHVAAAGHITPAQAESLRQAFWLQQGTKARAVVDAAVRRGLLTSAQADEAVRGYESMALQQSIGQFLVAAQLLTQVQANEMAGTSAGGSSSVVAIRTRWDAVSPKSQKIVMGIAGAIVLIPVFALVIGKAEITDLVVIGANGRGTATFTNRGRRSGSLCGDVSIVCGRGHLSSSTFCSGNVEPNESKQVQFDILNLGTIRNFNRTMQDDCVLLFLDD